jgi:hypothetical protein
LNISICGVFIDEEVDGVRDKESGDTTTVDTHTLLEAFLKCPSDLPVSLKNIFSGKKQNFVE